MKKIISMVLALILVISLCGCTIDVNVNYNYKEKTEMKTEEPVNDLNSIEQINQSEDLPGPVSISTQTQYNGQHINTNPNTQATFELDPYLD